MALITEFPFGAEIVDAIKALGLRIPVYAKYRNYYDGVHDMRYVTAKYRQKYGSVFAEFADNICRNVVNVPKARTILETISGDDRTDDYFKKRRLDGLQRVIHRDAYLYGDGYLLLWDKGSGPIPVKQNPSLIAPVYDSSEPGKMLAAAKVWVEKVEGQKRLRVTLYYDTEVRRLVASTGGESVSGIEKRHFEEYALDGDDAIQTHEFGVVPLFHWANQAGPGEMGISELADVIPLQDALNKSCFDMLINGEFTALQQRYATGIEDIKLGADGKPVNPFEGKSLWTTGSKDAKFGQLDAGDSEKLLLVVRDWRQEISVVSGIPTYYLQSDASIPSGTALQVIEAPLRDKITESQVVFGNVWEDVFSAATGVDVDKLTAVWKDTAPISLGETLDNAIKKKAIGYSSKQVMRELGLSDEEIATIEKERTAEEEVKAKQAQKLMTRDPFGDGPN